MARTINIFRVTAPGDGPTVADRIDFNAIKDTSVASAYIVSYEIGGKEALADNQSVQNALEEHQDLGPFEEIFLFRGFIALRDNGIVQGNNAFAQRLRDWKNEAKTNTNFIHGRFGVIFDDFDIESVTPVGTGSDQVGLIMIDLLWKNDFERKPLQANFELIFIKDKGDAQ